MILSGLLYHYYLDAFFHDPIALGFMNVRAILREFWKTTKKETRPTSNSGPESDESVP